MINYFVDRIRGIWVAVLTAASLGYGWLILSVAPMWSHLVAAQNGTELQGTFHYGADDVARVFADASLRADALLFYAVDVPNALLFGASIAALMGFGIRHLGASQSVLRWAIVLPLISGASDLVENASLTAALLTSPSERSVFGTLAGGVTTVKLATGYVSIVLMLVLVVAGIAREVWLRAKG